MKTTDYMFRLVPVRYPDLRHIPHAITTMGHPIPGAVLLYSAETNQYYVLLNWTFDPQLLALDFHADKHTEYIVHFLGFLGNAHKSAATITLIQDFLNTAVRYVWHSPEVHSVIDIYSPQQLSQLRTLSPHEAREYLDAHV